MDQRRAFLDAILAAPDDDTPRLVYADWLEEQGDEARSEFIRIQCKTAKPERNRSHSEEDDSSHSGTWPENKCPSVMTEGMGTVCQCVECLGERGRLLLSTGRDVWLDHWLPSWQSDCIGYTARYYLGSSTQPSIKATFRRGFVHALTCTAAAWIAHADTILREHPVRQVTLTTWPEQEAVEVDPVAGNRWYKARLAGRTALYDITPESTHEVREMLAAEWTGIDFKLPVPFSDRVFSGRSRESEEAEIRRIISRQARNP